MKSKINQLLDKLPVRIAQLIILSIEVSLNRRALSFKILNFFHLEISWMSNVKLKWRKFDFNGSLGFFYGPLLIRLQNPLTNPLFFTVFHFKLINLTIRINKSLKIKEWRIYQVKFPLTHTRIFGPLIIKTEKQSWKENTQNTH